MNYYKSQAPTKLHIGSEKLPLLKLICVSLPIISCSTPVIANMMVTGSLHGRQLQGPWD